MSCHTVSSRGPVVHFADIATNVHLGLEDLWKKKGGGFISGVEQRAIEHAGKVRMGSIPNNCNISPIARGCFTNVQRGCDNVAAYIQHPCKRRCRRNNKDML